MNTIASCSSHRETISRIAFLPSVSRRSLECGGGGGGGGEGGEGRVVSVCKDGVLCFWKNNLTLQRTVNVSKKNYESVPVIMDNDFFFYS